MTNFLVKLELVMFRLIKNVSTLTVDGESCIVDLIKTDIKPSLREPLDGREVGSSDYVVGVAIHDHQLILPPVAVHSNNEIADHFLVGYSIQDTGRMIEALQAATVYADLIIE
jgi:hypothetical protein